MFLRQIIDAFLVRTEPASSMVNPAHIHMTNAPQMRKAKVLRTNWVSGSTPAAWAAEGQAKTTPKDTMAAIVMKTNREWFRSTWTKPVVISTAVTRA